VGAPASSGRIKLPSSPNTDLAEADGYQVAIVIMLVGGLACLSYAGLCSATGEMSARTKDDFYRARPPLTRAEHPIEFRFLLATICAVGILMLFAAVGLYLLEGRPR
jgi:hypothetical protein